MRKTLEDVTIVRCPHCRRPTDLGVTHACPVLIAELQNEQEIALAMYLRALRIVTPTSKLSRELESQEAKIRWRVAHRRERLSRQQETR